MKASSGISRHGGVFWGAMALAFALVAMVFRVKDILMNRDRFPLWQRVRAVLIILMTVAIPTANDLFFSTDPNQNSQF